MLHKFSFHGMSKTKKKNQIVKKLEFTNNNGSLSEEVVEYMIKIGFQIDQIMLAHKLYKFITIDDAIQVMMRDNETNKFLHGFNSAGLYCNICNEEIKEHIEYEDDINQIELKSKFTNNINYNISKNVIDQINDPDICTICFDNKLNESSRVVLSCNHELCLMCIHNYLKHKINNGTVLKLRCLFGGCNKYFSFDEIKRYVDQDTFSKFHRFYQIQYTINNSKNKNIVNCPFPDCEVMFYVDDEEPFVECDYGHKFCSKCKSLGWHDKIKCTQYNNNLIEQINKNSKVKGKYKSCPACGIIIEKNDGCNHLKCSICEHEFCWLCMKEYSDDHYAIYNFTGCPGMRYSENREKRWWDNNFIKCLWFCLSCILWTLLLILILLFYIFFGACYELIKCYLNPSNEETEYNVDLEYQRSTQMRQEDEKLTCKQKFICFLLIIIGLILQPLYLMFYIIYGILQCYRRLPCWVIYASAY